MRWLALVIVLLAPASARAQAYTVRPGETAGQIAARHGIPLSELVRVNGLRDPDLIVPGQVLTLSGAEGEVVERGVLHVVMRGVTLGRIARAYEVPVQALQRANRIRNPDSVAEGSRILVPGATRVVPIATRVRPPCLRPAVEVHRVRTGESRRIVLARCDGSAHGPGVEELSELLDRTGADDPVLLNRRLVELVQRVAERFEGRRIEVVSAYRAPSRERGAGSRHAKAMALDFRVAGVPNPRLRDFARTLGDVGVGYYPNSTFVHLDVRDRPAFWVDWSGPGERPRYGSLARDPVAAETATVLEVQEQTSGEVTAEPLAAGVPRRRGGPGAGTSPGTSAAP